MEKINFKNSRNLNLVGNFYPADSDSIIVMAHGFTGDKSEWGRFDKTAEEPEKYRLEPHFSKRKFLIIFFNLLWRKSKF